jgi:hypothetical protein
MTMLRAYAALLLATVAALAAAATSRRSYRRALSRAKTPRWP